MFFVALIRQMIMNMVFLMIGNISEKARKKVLMYLIPLKLEGRCCGNTKGQLIRKRTTN